MHVDKPSKSIYWLLVAIKSILNIQRVICLNPEDPCFGRATEVIRSREWSIVELFQFSGPLDREKPADTEANSHIILIWSSIEWNFHDPYELQKRQTWNVQLCQIQDGELTLNASVNYCYPRHRRHLLSFFYHYSEEPCLRFQILLVINEHYSYNREKFRWTPQWHLRTRLN